MPIENNFQHDEMSRKNPGERLTMREATLATLQESPSGQEAMAAAGKRLSQAGVRLILLLHGSIMGTDLAKQIRVMVKEHLVDRIRERTGREAEQDIELTREEIVQEYLQGVKIVDRQIDEEKKVCSATAIMPKSQIQPNPTAVQ